MRTASVYTCTRTRTHTLTAPNCSGLRSGKKTSGYTFFKYQEKLLHCSLSRSSKRLETSPNVLCGNRPRLPLTNVNKGGSFLRQLLNQEETIHFASLRLYRNWFQAVFPLGFRLAAGLGYMLKVWWWFSVVWAMKEQQSLDSNWVFGKMS